MSSIQPLTGQIAVSGKPAYQIERVIGSGAFSICYLTRRILEDGSLGGYYVLKEFCPLSMEEDIQRSEKDGTIVPKSFMVRKQFLTMRSEFLKEASLCREINEAAGKGSNNYPWVLHSEPVPGRDDLLLISTENGFTITSFVLERHRHHLSRDYVLLCMIILRRLLEALRGVHRSMLHLDVSPNNVYIVTQAERLDSDSVFSVKVFDLASAHPKEDFLPRHRFQTLTTLACTPGFTDPTLLDFSEEIDERVDWYSAASILYFLLTGSSVPSDEPDFLYVSLPVSGVLENDALRSDLEELLSRALRLDDPFTKEDIEHDAFARQVDHMIVKLRYMDASPLRKAPPANAPVVVLPDEHEAMEDSLLSTFTPDETELYNLQQTIHLHHLNMTKDELDEFSCHSIPHIQEVMDETRKLFDALSPWLQANLPDDDLDIVRDYTLLGAKFHDIGMAGVDEMRGLLQTVDQLFTLVRSRNPGSKAAMNQLRASISALADTVQMKTPAYHLADHLSQSADLLYPQDRLLKALAAYHDEIKMEIRRRHATQSGYFILSNYEALEEHYGDSVDWIEVALIASMHSGADDHPRLDGFGGNKLSSDYIAAFMRSWDLDEFIPVYAKAKLRRILFSASILRLADCRRSGSRMLMTDLSSPAVRRSKSGRLSLMIEEDGILKEPAFSSAHSILLSEKLVDFGGVSLRQDPDGLTMVHEITLRHADTRDAQNLFALHRLPAYIEELQSTLLRTDHMQHILRIRCEDVDGYDADAVQMNAWIGKLRLKKGITAELME